LSFSAGQQESTLCLSAVIPHRHDADLVSSLRNNPKPVRIVPNFNNMA
jgi:hypothetical protein